MKLSKLLSNATDNSFDLEAHIAKIQKERLNGVSKLQKSHFNAKKHKVDITIR